MAGIGITLQDARIRRGLTIEQAAADTRISARFLEALEGERFGELPAPVYVRGFLRSYANYLKIDAQPLLDGLRLSDSPIPGPDGFVGGPRQAPQRGSQAGRSGDPFRRQPPPPPLPPPPAAVLADDQPEEVPDDRPVVGARRAGPPPVAGEPPAVGRRREPAYVQPPLEAEAGEPFGDYEDEAAYAPAEETYRPRRVAGVLLERPDTGRDAAMPARVVGLVAVGVVVVLIALAAAVLLTRNSGDKNAAATTGSPTALTSFSTVVAVGSPAASRTPASPSPSASATSSPSPTASVSPSPTGAVSATATAVPTQAGAAPTQAPTETPTPTPTTVPTPTPTLFVTPFVPTPTPVPLPSHPYGLTECNQNGYSCQSGDGYIYVVCAPNGWFVDVHEVNGVFANTLNWPIRQFTNSVQIGDHPCG